MNVPNTQNLPVQVVDGVPVFDCRWPDDQPQPRAPWGETLWGSERAAYSAGIRLNWAGDDVTPVSISGTPDLRKWPDEYSRIVGEMVKLFKQHQRDYELALKHPAKPGDGGSIFYKPVLVAVCNYGACLIADRKVSAVRRFNV